MALQNKQIDQGHARALLGLADPTLQIKLFTEIQANGYSVRQVEEMVKAINNGETVKSGRKKLVGKGERLPEEFHLLRTKLSDFFQTKVQMTCSSQGKGKISIPFSSEEELERIIKSYDPEALITGEAVLTDDLIDTSAVDFKVTNYISLAAIFLIIMVVFRSLSMPLVLVAAIELSIFINQGIPYFTGTVIPFVSPTIIGCVQLGATVDYAILMATRFREELRAGKSREDSIRIAATSSDASIITSSLVLFCATLGVGTISEIEIISSICMMLARGALISAVISMFIMPPVLCVCEPIFNKTSLHWRLPVKQVKEPMVSGK